jgi:ATP-dependent DNA helicase RecQ
MEYLMRQYPHFFIEAVRVKQQAICAALRLSKDRLHSALYQLQQENLIEYTDTATNLYIAFQVPREDQYTLRPAKDLLKKLKKQKVVKLNAIISFVKEEKKCRRNMILDYFGETKGSNCQQCSSASCKTDWDVCADFESKVIDLLKKQPHSIQELKQKLYFEPKALEALFAVLMERQQIIKNPQHKFYWIDE